MTARVSLRVGLTFLTVVQVAVGSWALILPRSFFDIPVVGMGMAFNEHLMRDYGAMSLASATVLGLAAVRMERSLTRAALLMYLVWAVGHFAIHVQLIHHLTTAQATSLMIALGVAILLTCGLLLLTRSDTENSSPSR